MKSRKVFFDGGCRPNPGIIEVAVVALGVTHYLGAIGEGDCNDAEWLALNHAVHIAQQFDIQDFVLLGDSALVINQALGVWKCRGERLQSHYDRYLALAANIGRIRLRKVRRSQNLAGIALARRRSIY